MKMWSYNYKGYNDLYLISSNMLNMYKAGISITNTIGLIYELPLTKNYKNSIKDIKIMLESGESLYKSFKVYENIYPDLFLSMIKIGEDTGKLEDVLSGLETYYKKVDFISKKVVGILTYPCLLVLATTLLIVFLGFGVIPTFGDIFITMDKDIPKALEWVLKINYIAKEFPIITLITSVIWCGIIPTIILIYNKKSICKTIAKVKILRMFKEYISVVLLSIVIRSGIGLAKGLTYCTECKLIANLNEYFKLINKDIHEGKTLASSIEKCDVFTAYTRAHIKVGEECGSLDNVMIKLEEQLYNKLMYEINKKLELISPIAIGFIGGIIMTFLMIFVLPIFEGLI